MPETTDTRSEMIARLKREVRDKTYRVKSAEIADKMAQKLREDQTPVMVFRKGRWRA